MKVSIFIQVSIRIICISFILSACNQRTENEVQTPIVNDAKKDKTAPIVNTNPHQLSLKNGKKWEVDPGMNKEVFKIEKALEKFKGKKLVDYQLLGDKIGDATAYIISSCTLKGQAHKELHKWLLPFLELKDALMMATSVEEGIALLLRIESEIKVYNTYFKN